MLTRWPLCSPHVCGREAGNSHACAMRTEFLHHLLPPAVALSSAHPHLLVSSPGSSLKSFARLPAGEVCSALQRRLPKYLYRLLYLGLTPSARQPRRHHFNTRRTKRRSDDGTTAPSVRQSKRWNPEMQWLRGYRRSPRSRSTKIANAR